MKKILALLLALCLVFSLVACGSDDRDDDRDDDEEQTEDDESDRDDDEDEDEEDKDEDDEEEETTEATEKPSASVDADSLSFDFYSYYYEEAELAYPDEPLDPEKVYSSLSYTPEMFQGVYVLLGGEDAVEDYIDEIEFIECELDRDYITALPATIRAGDDTLYNKFVDVKGYNWMEAVYCTYDKSNDNFYEYTAICSYTVDGNTITLNPVEEYKYDYDTETLTYTMSDIFWTYEFEFRGLYLTLSTGGQSVVLRAGVDEYSGENEFYGDAYLRPGTTGIDDLTSIELRLYDPEVENVGEILFEYADDSWPTLDAVAKMTDDGLLTFSIHRKIGDEIHQYVYFYCGEDGLILTDGTNTYYYTANWKDYNYAQQLDDNLEQDELSKLEELTDDKLEQIVQMKADLLTDLADAYNAAGLNVAIDAESGVITLDSTILFASDEYEVSADGKEFLKKFMSVYTSVVFDEKYADFVSKIMVEGHTDTNGSYEMNLELSQNRADSVKNFCLSADCGISAEHTQALTDTMEAIGYSYDYPILDRNGEVDMDASRRVSFRFQINLEG